MGWTNEKDKALRDAVHAAAKDAASKEGIVCENGSEPERVEYSLCKLSTKHIEMLLDACRCMKELEGVAPDLAGCTDGLPEMILKLARLDESIGKRIQDPSHQDEWIVSLVAWAALWG